MKKNFFWLFLIFVFYNFLFGQNAITIARVQYKGGGDWYNDRTIIPNILKYFTKETGIATGKEEVVQLDSIKLFNYPILFITGHGNIFFTEEEVRNLRQYLLNGGFLYVDDDYGMDKYFRREIVKVFPDREMIELPLNHILFNIKFRFPKGLPKIHEHEPGPPKCYAILDDNQRITVLYTFNSNISDGWASPDVHNDPAEIREQALKMGVNIILYALTN